MINGFSFFPLARTRLRWHDIEHSEIDLNENLHAWEIERVCVCVWCAVTVGIMLLFFFFVLLSSFVTLTCVYFNLTSC